MSTAYKSVSDVINEVRLMVTGKDECIYKVFAAILAGGHILIEDVPGVGKTTLATAFSRVMGLLDHRVQFTPDVMPADILGFKMYQKETGTFAYYPGPIMCNLFLADEINRTSPKTQSALLEVMEEGMVTVDGVSREVPQPFVVMATQNPKGSAGTQLLPEAQLDRFMFKILVRFPGREELKGIVALTEGSQEPEITKQMDSRGLMAARALVNQIPIADAVMDYLLDIVMDTHAGNPYIREGASPRAAQALIRAARAKAFLERRFNVSFQDVKQTAFPVLRHRIILNFDAVSEGISEDDVIEKILEENARL